MRGVLATIVLLVLTRIIFAQSEPDTTAMDRVVKIAQALKPGMTEDKVAPLVTEAARLCGFVIWNEDRTPLLQPSSSTRLKLALTDAEIQLYSQMFSQGQGVAIGDVANAYSHIVKQDDMAEPITALLVGELNELSFSADANSQMLGAFLTNQANVHGTVTGFFDEETELNAIQALVILRVLTEDTLLASRSGGKLGFGHLGLNRPLYASLRPMPLIEVPGWQEDGYAGVMTSVVSTVVDFFEAEGMKNNLGVANLLSGIVKFIATYACLKGEITIEDPGSPLVRKQSTAAGERRTLNAKFTIDGNKATEFLKKNRKYFLQIGLDVDMPKSGPLGGVETKWEIGQSQSSSKNHLIQTVGQQDISKIVTDDAGIAKLTVEGVPRSEAVDPKTATAVIKRIGILVTPQVKSTEMKQDVVDAIFGAMGIKDGPTGLLTPMMETLYRLKWKGSQYYPLLVRDWEPGANVASLTIEIKGSGRVVRPDYQWFGSVQRTFDFESMPVQIDGVALMPKLDPAVLKNLPPLQRQQMEEGMRQAEKAARRRTYRAVGPGALRWSIQDSSLARMIEDCELNWGVDEVKVEGGDYESLPGPKKGDSDMHFMIAVDEEAKTATISVMKIFDVIRSWRKVVGRKPSSGKNKNTVKVIDGIKFDDSASKKVFVLPLKKTDEDGSTGANYYGADSFHFTFGGGGKGSGTMIVSYAISRIKKAK